MKRITPLKYVILVILVTAAFSSGFTIGRKYSTNPQIVTYRNQEIIVQPGDAICPEGHICSWKPWDLDTNQALEKVKVK